MGHTVFLSHASSDAGQADLLRSVLESDSPPISCWMAPRDVPPGTRYAEGILQGIQECSVFLLLYSHSAEQSFHVMNEIEEAASRGRRILLVRMDDADPHDNRGISIFLGSHQWFDASERPFFTYLGDLSAAVRALVPATSARPGPKSRAPGKRAIGVEVTRTHVLADIVDLEHPDASGDSGTVHVAPLGPNGNIKTLLELTKNVVSTVVQDNFTRDQPPVGIGLALPGQVDPRVGSLKFGPNLFAARNVPFRSSLMSVVPGIPIRVDNDVRCATRAEAMAGMGGDFDSFVCIFVGAGVGSGLVINRKLHFGNNFCAGEIGHIKVSPSGPPCSCGQFGCLETFVKESAILSRAAAKVIDCETRGQTTLLSRGEEAGELTMPDLIEALEAGDQATDEVLNEIAEHLGSGIANYVNLLNPSGVVLVGELMDSLYMSMIEQISDSLRRHSLAEVANTPIVQSSLGKHAVALGAALMFHPDDDWPF